MPITDVENRQKICAWIAQGRRLELFDIDKFAIKKEVIIDCYPPHSSTKPPKHPYITYYKKLQQFEKNIDEIKNYILANSSYKFHELPEFAPRLNTLYKIIEELNNLEGIYHEYANTVSHTNWYDIKRAMGNAWYSSGSDYIESNRILSLLDVEVKNTLEERSQLIYERNQMAFRWLEYFEDLYKNSILEDNPILTARESVRKTFEKSKFMEPAYPTDILPHLPVTTQFHNDQNPSSPTVSITPPSPGYSSDRDTKPLARSDAFRFKETSEQDKLSIPAWADNSSDQQEPDDSDDDTLAPSSPRVNFETREPTQADSDQASVTSTLAPDYYSVRSPITRTMKPASTDKQDLEIEDFDDDPVMEGKPPPHSRSPNSSK